MYQEYLAVAIKAVQTSGDILVDYFGKLHDFKQKNQNIRDLVTKGYFIRKTSRKELKKFFHIMRSLARKPR